MSPGRWLFRYRSLTALPVIVALVLLCWRDAIHPGPGGPALDSALNLLGAALTVLGAAIRFLTVGFTPHGSQTRTVSARSLCTTGAYAWVRHPLYLGNALIVTGLLCVLHRPLAWALGGGFFLLATALIIREEEAHLAATFGDTWRTWAAQVPLLLPRPVRGAFTGPFAWRAAIRREVNPLVAWGLGLQLLLGWEWWARAALTDERALPLKLGLGALLGLLVANKLWKKVRP